MEDIVQIPGNDHCVDCGQPDPQWAVMNIGIFVCEACAGIHNNLGPQISKVKSLLVNCDDEQMNFMRQTGNEASRLIYEKYVPACYKRPVAADPLILRDQWIRAKYERREFTSEGVLAIKQPYLNGRREGYLWKRGKEDRHFQKRRFVLDSANNSLKYYIKDVGDNPKATIRLDDLNMSFAQSKVGNPNAMQISYEADGRTRNIFVYADTAQDAVEWFTAIRSSKLNRLAVAYPCATMEELCGMISRDYVKEGWLSKTGPRSGDAFRRRWVTLERRKLLYYDDPLDAYAKGEIHFGTKGFEVVPGFGTGCKYPGYGFILKTPGRNYQFSAEVEEERSEWLRLLNQVINE